jgi:hypothetical protein
MVFMGRNVTREVEYRCINDCRESGCPGHKMRISYCRTSDTVSVEIDGKSEHCFDGNSFGALRQLINEKP